MARYRSKLTAIRFSIEVGAAMRYMNVQKLHKNSPPLHWYGCNMISTSNGMEKNAVMRSEMARENMK